MNPDDHWLEDSRAICQVCEHPLCNGKCEAQPPDQLIMGGLIGLAILGIALLIRAIA